MRRGFEQVFKLAQRAGANYIAFITDEIVGSFFVLVQIDVEVVEPEVGHDFLKLGAGIDVASEPLGSQLVDHNALGVLERVNKLSLRWAQVGDECCTLRRLEGLAEAVEFRLLHGAQTANALLGREGEDANDLFLGELRLVGIGRGSHPVHLAGIGGARCFGGHCRHGAAACGRAFWSLG